MKKIIITICFTFFCINISFADFTLPTDANYPGGVAIVKLADANKMPKVYYDSQRVLVLSSDKNWYAIVGIPLTAEIVSQQITVKPNKGKAYSVSFTLHDHTYPLRNITITDQSKVTPDAALAKTIQSQQNLAKKLFKTWTVPKELSTDFILPAKGWFSSYFGIRRIYNNTLNSRHTGLDIAAPAGAPIDAAGNGTVLAVKNFVLTGNTVIINHGEGLMTIYCHMSKVDVKPGQTVTQGQLLGEVGATGRVTGPHLHWEVVLNGVKVNPTLFVPSLNKIK